MILVDTSVWVDHLRKGRPALERLLEDGLVLGHPWVIGERRGAVPNPRLGGFRKIEARDRAPTEAA